MNDPGMMAAGFAGPPDTSLMDLAVYATVGMFVLLAAFTMLAVLSLPIFFAALGVMELGLRTVQAAPDPVGKFSKLGGLVFRSLRRNLLRTALTYVALFVLTGMLSFFYILLTGVTKLTQDKEDAQLVILTEKYGIPSMMPPGHESMLKGLMLSKLPPEHRPADLDKGMMTWSFVGGTLDPNKMTADNNMFLFAIDPSVVTNGMMTEQGLNPEDLGEDGWEDLKRVIAVANQDKRHVVVGQDRLDRIGKRVGDQLKLYGTNYKDIEFDCIIVGAFPSGSRMGMNAAMRYDYLLSKLDEYKTRTGNAHPVADRCLNLVWVRMPSKAAYQQLAAVVNEPSAFPAPAVKMETFSAAVGSFIEPFKDILWGLKYLIMPAIVVIMCLVIGITITIGVRERWAEMAVMKVLGFQPWQVMTMIAAEASLIGLYGGLLSTWTVYYLPQVIKDVNRAAKGNFHFFDNFKPEGVILIAGPVLGVAVGLVGAALPAWNARKVKVSEVFAQVA